MSDEFLLQLFLKRDKEIKDLVIETLAQSCLPNCEPTPPQQILDRLQNVMSARHQNEVKDLALQIGGLKSFVNEQKEKIRWLRSQYEGVLNQQKKTYEDRITELQNLKKEQASAASPQKVMDNQLQRLRKVADMVPDLIKQFESERQSIRKEAQDKCKDQHKLQLQRLSQVLKQIKQQVNQLKSEGKKNQPEAEKRGQTGQSRVLSSEGKEKSAQVLHLEYCERLIRQFKQRRRA